MLAFVAPVAPVALRVASLAHSRLRKLTLRRLDLRDKHYQQYDRKLAALPEVAHRSHLGGIWLFWIISSWVKHNGFEGSSRSVYAKSINGSIHLNFDQSNTMVFYKNEVQMLRFSWEGFDTFETLQN